MLADTLLMQLSLNRTQKQHLKVQFSISILLISTKENSRIRTAHTEKHSKFKQLEMLLDVEQNSKMAATPRMEEKIQRLQKQLSDLKLSNKNMKTQLTRINVLKVSAGLGFQVFPVLWGPPVLMCVSPGAFILLIWLVHYRVKCGLQNKVGVPLREGVG